jgi:hypothetical protein
MKPRHLQTDSSFDAYSDCTATDERLLTVS